MRFTNGLAACAVVLMIVLASSSPASASTPTVATVAASSVTYNAAVLNGNLTAMGAGNTNVKVGFHWGTSATLVGATNMTTGNRTTTGTFSDSVSGLNAVTVYYFRAWARNFTGGVDRPQFAQSSILSFITETDPVILAMEGTTNMLTTLLVAVIPLFIIVGVFNVISRDVRRKERNLREDGRGRSGNRTAPLKTRPPKAGIRTNRLPR